MKPYIIIIYLLIVNLWAFIIMGIDKKKAIKNKWRISEKSLFIPVLLGGGIGGTAGMHLFRHKTRHWYFRYGYPVILITQILLVLYFYM